MGLVSDVCVVNTVWGSVLVCLRVLSVVCQGSEMLVRASLNQLCVCVCVWSAGVGLLSHQGVIGIRRD